MFHLGYFLSCFGILLSVNSFIANTNHNKGELAAAFIHEGTRIEVSFENNENHYDFPESNFVSFDYNGDSYLFYNAMLYCESYISDNQNPFISDEDVKVIVHDGSNNNYFGVNLLEGTYPNDNSVIVSKEFAEKYEINELPHTLSFNKILNGEELEDKITICGVFDGEGNQYTHKPDRNGNEASGLCIIAKNSKNMQHFAAFNRVFQFLTSDDITNAFLIQLGLSTIGGIRSFKAYDSLSSMEENSQLTTILNRWYTNGFDLFIFDTKIISIVIFVISLAVFILLNAWFFVKQRIRLDIFMTCLVDILLSLLLIVLFNNTIIGGNVVMLMSHFSSLILLAEVGLIISVILVINIFAMSNRNKRDANYKISKLEKNKNGLVSVIIPTYNGARYLKYAIDSALNQTYKNIEIIVVNDGSTDNGKTDKIIEKYKGQVKYIKKENGGVSTALNLGIQKASGYFINWLSHDDELKPNSIEERLKQWILYGMDDKIIIGSSVSFINEKEEQITRVAAKSRDIKGISDLLKSTVNGCSLLIPKTAFRRRKFAEGVIYMPDFYMWADLINSGYSIINIPEKLVNSRVHNKQITRNRTDLLELDFKTFFEENVESNFKTTSYKELRKVMFILKRRSHIRPFYKQYINKIKKHLKDTEHYNFWDSLELGINGFISWLVFIARKVTSKWAR